MERIVLAVLLAFTAQAALAAEKPWPAGWYQVEVFPEVKYGEEPYDAKASCQADLPPPDETILVCARLTKPADALDAAIAAFSDIIKKQPNAAVIFDQRGNLYMQKGNTVSAVADYTRAMKLKPDDVWAYVLRGNAYEKSGKREQAIADYKAAVAHHPDADMLKDVQARLKGLG